MQPTSTSEMSSIPASKGVVNIPRTVTDRFYRYTMPDLAISVGRSGRTVLVNMSEVSEALGRPPELPTKFMGFSLGSMAVADERSGRYAIKGRHDRVKLCSILDQFIDRYVLCGTCHNPETVLRVCQRSRSATLGCKACGADTSVETLDKMGAYILKHPPPLPEDEQRERRESCCATSPLQHEEEEEEEEEEWSTDVSPEAVAARQRELVGTGVASRALGQGVIQVVIAALSGAMGDTAGALKSAYERWGRDNAEMARCLVIALFGRSSASQTVQSLAATKAPLLSPFCQGSGQAQWAVLDLLNEMLEGKAAGLPSKTVPHVLKELYDRDVLEEEHALSWADGNKSSPLSVAAAPFLNWLRTAEEDDVI